MPATMAVEHLLACETDLDGPVEQPGGFRDDDLVVEWVALSTEPAAVRRGNDADVRRRHVEGFCERAVDEVRRLCARTQDELPIRIPSRDGPLLHQREMSV